MEDLRNNHIAKSFIDTEDLICKALDQHDLIKGAKHSEGDVRVYKGKAYEHSKGKWAPKQDKSLHEHAKATAEKHLKKTTSESKDPVLREHAHKELRRREKEESHKVKPKSKPKKKVQPTKVIGKTQSGKDVTVLSHWDDNSKGFSAQDHLDAGALHSQAYDRAKEAHVKENHNAGRKFHAGKGKFKKAEEDDLMKGGPGSGRRTFAVPNIHGHIGITSSGRNIHLDPHHPDHAHFTVQDHEEAAESHNKRADKMEASGSAMSDVQYARGKANQHSFAAHALKKRNR
jgi:hypothetical protein